MSDFKKIARNGIFVIAARFEVILTVDGEKRFNAVPEKVDADAKAVMGDGLIEDAAGAPDFREENEVIGCAMLGST